MDMTDWLRASGLLLLGFHGVLIAAPGPIPQNAEHTRPRIFSADETADVGMDDTTPVVDGIGEGSATRFTGKIEQVTVEVR